MTPAEMDTILRGLGWSRSELARRLCRPEGVVRRWRVVPSLVANWLHAMIRWTLTQPPQPDLQKRARSRF